MCERARIDIMRLEPTNIQQIGDELAIVWNDGIESYFNLQFLRRACPCAACGGEPDVVGNIVRPTVTYSSEVFSSPDSISSAVMRCNRAGPMGTGPVFTALLTCVAWDRLRGDRHQVVGANS